MKPKSSDWYKNGWTLDIMNQSWTENTIQQVDFIIDKLQLKGNEKILDLACGYGRHALEFAKRGYEVVGVDITKEYVEYGNEQAKIHKIPAEFICCDIREVSFENEFDVVLNMADGAVGYLEDDRENMKIFEIVSKALKPNGKHFMDIMSGDYADTHFPCKLWDAGENGITLSEFEWDKETCRMLYGQIDYSYGEILQKPEIEYGDCTRLYRFDEIKNIFEKLGMNIVCAYSDISGNEYTKDSIQMMIFSQKQTVS